MIIKTKKLILNIFIGIIFLFPINTYAAEIFFKVIPNETVGDDAIIVEAYVDTKLSNINVVDGIIRLEEKDGAKISSVIVETGGSAFNWWPSLPKYSSEDDSIKFSGGSLNGVEKSGLIFRMRIFASHSGKIKISWMGGESYLNDGKGTVEYVYSKSLLTHVEKGEPNQINPASSDNIPPVFDTVLLGSDKYLHDGKYFLSFHANDEKSGIIKYVVREGGRVTEVLDGVYVLYDQSRNTRVDITAYDNAGNSRSVIAPLGHQYTISSIIISIIILVLIILIIRYAYIEHYKR